MNQKCDNGICKYFTHNNKKLPSAKEMADDIWETYTYYWDEENDLITKQKITHNVIAEIVRVLRYYGIEDLGYWNDVSIEIYKKND